MLLYHSQLMSHPRLVKFVRLELHTLIAKNIYNSLSDLIITVIHFTHALQVIQWNYLSAPIATLTNTDSFKLAVSQVCHMKP